MHFPKRLLSTGAMLAAIAMSSLLVVQPASADEPVDTTELALSEFRQNLVSEGAQEDLAKFDALTTAQEAELAEYLLGESVSATAPPADAEVEGNGILSYGDFEWGSPVGNDAVAARGWGLPMWGTQWFSFAGISITQVKISLTFEMDFDPNYGTVVSGIQSHSCQVQHNYDVFAEVTTTKDNAFTDGPYEAEGQCLVRVKRGAPTPLGQITWSTKEAIHYLRADNTGWITGHGWK